MDLGAATSAGLFIELTNPDTVTPEKPIGTARTYPLYKLTIEDLGWIANWIKEQLPDPREEARKTILAFDPGPMPEAPPLPVEKEGVLTPMQEAEFRGKLAAYERNLSRWNRLKETFDRQIDRVIDKMDQATRTDVMSTEAAMAQLHSVKGVALLLYMSARKGDPMMQPDHFKFIGKLPSAEIHKIRQVIDKINEVPEELKEAADAKNSFAGPAQRLAAFARKLLGLKFLRA